jgi:hypothetical protein
MLYDIDSIYGRKLGATDGDIGHVKDFYFDDQTWAVRYVVVDTGAWLSGREVLLSPHAFTNHAFENISAMRVNLSRLQIENSPAIDLHRPVTRQYEAEYYHYYNWPNYWDGGMLGVAGFPAYTPGSLKDDHLRHNHHQRDDIHLRSTRAVTGYRMHATDGEIGTVSSFMLHGRDWEIRELIIETGHWYAGKTIFLRPENVTRISYEVDALYVNLTLNDIQQTQPNEIAHGHAVQL